MKKRFSRILLLAILIVVLAAAFTACSCKHEWSGGVCSKCNEACTHDWNKETGVCKICGMNCEHDWSVTHKCKECQYVCKHEEIKDGDCVQCNYTCEHTGTHVNGLVPICDICGRPCTHQFGEDMTCACGAGTIFDWVDNTESLRGPCEQAGTIETLTYTTHAYQAEKRYGEENLMTEKQCYVYLPYGYDKSKQYNILYLEHGYTMNLDTYFYTTDVINLVDNMIAQGICDPFIMVATTYVTDMPGYPVGDNETDPERGFNYNYDALVAELREAIVPAVESKYSTYANGDVSVESLTASRDHRAYAGYSFGSFTSYGIAAFDLEYFSYIVSMHAPGLADEVIESFTPERVEAYPINFWYCGQSVEDNPDGQAEPIEAMLAADIGLEYGKNICYVVSAGLPHAEQNSMLALYNALQVMFRMDDPEIQALAEQGLLK